MFLPTNYFSCFPRGGLGFLPNYSFELRLRHSTILNYRFWRFGKHTITISAAVKLGNSEILKLWKSGTLEKLSTSSSGNKNNTVKEILSAAQIMFFEGGSRFFGGEVAHICIYIICTESIVILTCLRTTTQGSLEK